MQKKAYPHNDHGVFVNSPHNIGHWMKSMQEVYARSPMVGWSNAFEAVTSGWDDMEKRDFKNWMSFYQEGGHQKYKTAQFKPISYVENGGSFVPVDHLKASLPVKTPDMSSFIATQDVNAAQEKDAQKALVERKIQSLIGRLNSAEKIATNPQVQLALKKCLQMSVDEWVSLLQKLKREIQLAPMRFTVASLVDDIVYKNANQAYAAGYKNAASMLIKLAQVTPAAPATPPAPAAPSTPAPSTPGGVTPMTPGDTPMGGQPLAPGANPAPNGDMVGTPDDKGAITEFLKNLNFTDVADIEDGDEEDSEGDEAEITVTAQAAPGAEDLPLAPNPAPSPDPKPRPAPAAPATPAATPDIEVTDTQTDPQTGLQELEVSEDEVSLPPGDPFDQALSSVEVKDIIVRLEGIASMFKNRQIARQLSIIDLMMDKIGIAPFFPTLAEAMRSALESNQYCQSRVEEILAKLRGTIATPMSQHLEGEVSGQNALQEDQVKSQLAQQEEAERVRKERRKMLQEKEEAEALTPQPSPGQELAGPAQVQTAPAIRPAG
ncbi:hypothetical protein E6Q11_02940 [Candidatus Dojkabacteria bacterium]|uniref:Uncharacterized protein n=1 Tax=Candidatus Dojkabacteria bacterium TaxID=2099670 RepID=A0A5C7J7H7_9BACT|nr:MAG: hypothetical protein E6Q11_02940 [Candidatus Dojkabacteria bacterium]